MEPKRGLRHSRFTVFLVLKAQTHTQIRREKKGTQLLLTDNRGNLCMHENISTFLSLPA